MCNPHLGWTVVDRLCLCPFHLIKCKFTYLIGLNRYSRWEKCQGFCFHDTCKVSFKNHVNKYSGFCIKLAYVEGTVHFIWFVFHQVIPALYVYRTELHWSSTPYAYMHGIIYLCSTAMTDQSHKTQTGKTAKSSRSVFAAYKSLPTLFFCKV